jgi:hypothetical protein
MFFVVLTHLGGSESIEMLLSLRVESPNLLRGYAEKNNTRYRRAANVANLIRNKVSNFLQK